MVGSEIGGGAIVPVERLSPGLFLAVVDESSKEDPEGEEMDCMFEL